MFLFHFELLHLMFYLLMVNMRLGLVPGNSKCELWTSHMGATQAWGGGTQMTSEPRGSENPHLPCQVPPRPTSIRSCPLRARVTRGHGTDCVSSLHTSPIFRFQNPLILQNLFPTPPPPGSPLRWLQLTGNSLTSEPLESRTSSMGPEACSPCVA